VSVILVIDEHKVHRGAIRELIEAKLHDARVVELSKNQYFDLVLVDSGSLSSGLLTLLKQAHELSPTTRFAVMSTSETWADALNCLSAGFHGFVNKSQSRMRSNSGRLGICFLDESTVPRWIADGDDHSLEIPPSINTRVKTPKLTRRQNEILPLIAQGMSNKEIAKLLNIAEGTTKIHTAALLHALGARNRTEAASIAAKLVESDKAPLLKT
jgi:DNA-binding NarL/FixJ family response regulator